MKKLNEKSGRARGLDRRLLRNFRAAKLRCSAAEPCIAMDINDIIIVVVLVVVVVMFTF